MDRRLELHEILVDILGSRNVYFQPPSDVRMKYPAIVYKRTDIDILHADDGVHRKTTAYEVIVIDPDPDSEIVYKVADLPKCRFMNHYTADNLNHDAFKLYY